MFSRLISKPVRTLLHWINPAHELARLATLAQDGSISVEELTTAGVSQGRLRPLATVLATVLLDQKQQRAEVAALEQEMRDRIANRTDALERKIGSLQLQATRDALTGLGNRRGLDANLPRMIDRYRNAGPDVCLLMIDVDHFKSLNDTLGHAAGDQLLRDIGQLIRSTLRGNDQAYRSGGDEFVILLHDCETAAGQAIANRLEVLVRGLTKTLAVAYPPQLSIGLCAASEIAGVTTEMLLHTADTRLYDVKSTRPRTRKSA